MVVGSIAVKSSPPASLSPSMYRWVVWIDRVEEAKTKRLLVC
jgi:hypothetical protein